MRSIRLAIILGLLTSFAPLQTKAQETPPFYEVTASCSSTSIGIGFINVPNEKEFEKLSEGIDQTCGEWPQTIERDIQVQSVSVTCGATQISILVSATPKATPEKASEVYFSFVTSCWPPSETESPDQQNNLITNEMLCGTLRYQTTVISEGNVPEEMITPVLLGCQAKPNGFSPAG